MEDNDKQKQSNNLAPEGVDKHHKVFVAMAVFFFFYLVIEGMILLPAIVLKYGWF